MTRLCGFPQNLRILRIPCGFLNPNCGIRKFAVFPNFEIYYIRLLIFCSFSSKKLTFLINLVDLCGFCGFFLKILRDFAQTFWSHCPRGWQPWSAHRDRVLPRGRCPSPPTPRPCPFPRPPPAAPWASAQDWAPRHSSDTASTLTPVAGPPRTSRGSCGSAGALLPRRQHRTGDRRCQTSLTRRLCRGSSCRGSVGGILVMSQMYLAIGFWGNRDVPSFILEVYLCFYGPQLTKKVRDT